jgi:hypothetical protein
LIPFATAEAAAFGPQIGQPSNTLSSKSNTVRMEDRISKRCEAILLAYAYNHQSLSSTSLEEHTGGTGAETEGTVNPASIDLADTFCLLLPPKSFASLSLLRVGCDMAGDEAVRVTASDPACMWNERSAVPIDDHPSCVATASLFTTITSSAAGFIAPLAYGKTSSVIIQLYDRVYTFVTGRRACCGKSLDSPSNEAYVALSMRAVRC